MPTLITPSHAGLQVSAVFSKYGGSAAERAIYRVINGQDLGPPRWPATPFNDADLPALQKELDGLGFFQQRPPQQE